jgi:hypothetical protein
VVDELWVAEAGMKLKAYPMVLRAARRATHQWLAAPAVD